MINRFLFVVCCFLLCVGCVHVGPKHPHGMPPGQAKKFACVHSAECNHVLIDGVWVEISFGHVHSSGCGHYLKNGQWWGDSHPGKGKGKHK